jgi:hypothetical protein
MLFWTHPSLARHADVSFFTKRGEPFQVVLDGRLINRYATDLLHLPAIPAGFHVAEIRLPDRFGALVHRTRIYVEPGFKIDYQIQVVGRRPKVVVSKVRQYPLPAVARPLPDPYRPRPDRHGRYHDDYRGKYRYEDRRQDRYEEEDKNRYDDREDNRYENRENGRYEDRADDPKHRHGHREIFSAINQKPPLLPVRAFNFRINNKSKINNNS